MAYNQDNVERVRNALAGKEIVEKNMFGSRGFMVNGKLAVCVKENDLMFKLSQQDYENAVADGTARPMVQGKRAMKQWVFVENEKLKDGAIFSNWLDAALKYNQSTTVISK